MRLVKPYRELMQNVHDAKLAFDESFREIGSWKNEKDKKAVAKAKKLLESFKEHVRALDVRLTPLIETIRPGNEHVIDEVLEFLVVDVLAFRSGYAKEKFYRRLKHVELSPAQIEKIKNIALQRCASKEYRRDDSDLRRLVTKHADLEFLDRVAEIPAAEGSRVEGHKKQMFQTVLAGRKDLRESLRKMAGRKGS
jgi:hypothetical protein